MKRFHITYFINKEKTQLGGQTIWEMRVNNIIEAIEFLIENHTLKDGSKIEISMIKYAIEM